MARTQKAAGSRARPPARKATRKSAAASTARKVTRKPAAATRARTPRASEPSSGLAPGMQPISAYLAVRSVEAAAAFLESVVGLTRGVVLAGPDGAARYAEMRHGHSTVVLVPAGDASSAAGGAPALYTYVDDVDERLAAAARSGATTARAEDAPWGDRVGTVVDPDGYRWVLATFKKLAPFS